MSAHQASYHAHHPIAEQSVWTAPMADVLSGDAASGDRASHRVAITKAQLYPHPSAPPPPPGVNCELLPSPLHETVATVPLAPANHSLAQRPGRCLPATPQRPVLASDDSTSRADLHRYLRDHQQHHPPHAVPPCRLSRLTRTVTRLTSSKPLLACPSLSCSIGTTGCCTCSPPLAVRIGCSAMPKSARVSLPWKPPRSHQHLLLSSQLISWHVRLWV
jgi:hypothetical protein